MEHSTNSGLREYFQTTFEAKLLSALPEDALQQTTPATQLLVRKQQTQQLEQALEQQKEEFRVRMETLRKRRAELERKEAQLQESLLKFDRFLKENDARRDRAERKQQEEFAVVRKREEEAANLSQELERLLARRTQNKTLLGRYAKYEQYLKSVLSLSGEYPDTEELMARHAALLSTHEDLRQREAATQATMDGLRREAAAFKEDHRVHMLSCNNRLTSLLAQKEAAETEALQWEQRHSEVQSTATTRTLLLGQIKMATANLFALVQRQAKVSQAADNPIAQLEKVQHYLQDLQDITEAFEAEMQQSANNNGANGSSSNQATAIVA